MLYFMDRARRDLLVQAPRHGERRGTFALRSPVRPNPIAMSVVRLVGIDGTKLSVVGLDCLDGTPLIDIKPYFASVDSVPDAVVAQRRSELSAHPREAGIQDGGRRFYRFVPSSSASSGTTQSGGSPRATRCTLSNALRKRAT